MNSISGDGLLSDWQPYINLLGRIFLGFYFLKAGINNALNLKKVSNLVKSKKIPFASFIVFIVISIEIMGSLGVIFNYFAIYAAFLLILFTLTVNFLICNYWVLEGVNRRNTSFVFYANFAVIGALLLIISMQ